MSDTTANAIIRLMTTDDIDRVVAIAATLPDAPHWPRSAYIDALNPESAPRRIALIASEANAIVGFAIVSFLAPQAELETISIVPDSQRRGWGSRLFHELAAQLRQAGAGELLLEVRASNSGIPAGSPLSFPFGFAQSGTATRAHYADPVEDAALNAALDFHKDLAPPCPPPSLNHRGCSPIRTAKHGAAMPESSAVTIRPLRYSQICVTFSKFPPCPFYFVGDICKCSNKFDGSQVPKTSRRNGRCLMDEINGSTLGEEIDRLHAEHRRYAQRLEDLLQKPYLTEDEQLEEVRLKKLKLHAKDLIFAIERRMTPAVA